MRVLVLETQPHEKAGEMPCLQGRVDKRASLWSRKARLLILIAYNRLHAPSGKKQQGEAGKNPSLKAPVIALARGYIKVMLQGLGMVEEYAREEVGMLVELVCHP